MVVAYKLTWFSVHAGEDRDETGIIQNVPPGGADKAVEGVVAQVMRSWMLERRPRVAYQAADGVVEGLIAAARLP